MYHVSLLQYVGSAPNAMIVDSRIWKLISHLGESNRAPPCLTGNINSSEQEHLVRLEDPNIYRVYLDLKSLSNGEARLFRPDDLIAVSRAGRELRRAPPP